MKSVLLAELIGLPCLCIDQQMKRYWLIGNGVSGLLFRLLQETGCGCRGSSSSSTVQTVWEENANYFDLCVIKTFLSSVEASRKQINTSLPPQETDRRGGVATCPLTIFDEVTIPAPLTWSHLDLCLKVRHPPPTLPHPLRSPRQKLDDAFLGGVLGDSQVWAGVTVWLWTAAERRARSASRHE